MDPLTGLVAAFIAFKTGTAIGKVVCDIEDLMNDRSDDHPLNQKSIEELREERDRWEKAVNRDNN
jgi:ubiquitin-protein ligase